MDIKWRLNIGLNISRYAILLCIDMKKSYLGAIYKIMNEKYRSEFEVRLATARLDLQSNALGLKL